MEVSSSYIESNKLNKSKIADLNKSIQDQRRAALKTEGVRRRSPEILRYIHREHDPLNVGRVAESNI